ncbi:MAG TPA: (Fe-S)-binding protein [Pyrodictium delaneyi]|uniref:(Fe-S)-binding protein n=1 Tax=Pyrodictium delaneyi TaxID=1273541 RepID=A0A832ZSA8_9CREN|nr:(Fe-S)-binding protein [Pyrodictium delaneyi]
MASLREAALLEAQRCLYCGFCEAVCPTLLYGAHRGYGPRGRVSIALQLLAGKAPVSEEALASIYSCLMCRACTTKCPVSVNVAEIVRIIRILHNRGELLAKSPVRIAVRG